MQEEQRSPVLRTRSLHFNAAGFVVAGARTPDSGGMTDQATPDDAPPNNAPLNFKSELTGCFSTPCAENPTVAMLEAAYAAAGLDYRYINAEVQPDGLAAAVAGAKAMGWRGFNLSIPHKVAVIEHLDRLGESAAIIGAVNCVVHEADGSLVGQNTDGKGFLQSLKEVVNPTGKRLVLLGAGGAARAIGVEVALAGASHVTVVNRSPDRGRTLADLLSEKTPAEVALGAWTGDFAIPPDTDIVVNATSIGLFPDTSRVPIDAATLRSDLVVADVIPNPPRTRLLAEADAAGATTLDGLRMLVNQGVIGVRYWTGREVDAGVMRDRLENLFG